MDCSIPIKDKICLEVPTDRIPARLMLHAKHHCSANKFTIEEYLEAEPGTFGDNTKGIGKRASDKNRSYKRGTPGNISLCVDAFSLVKGKDDIVYYLPPSIYNGLKTGEIEIKADSQKITINACSEHADVIKRFFSRKSVMANRRYGKAKHLFKSILSPRGTVSEHPFEQRKMYYSVCSGPKTEKYVTPFQFWSYPDIECGANNVSYYIPQAYLHHPQQPNLIVPVYESFEYKMFYILPFEIWSELFSQVKPNSADRFVFIVRDGNIITESSLHFDIKEYSNFSKVADSSAALTPMSIQTDCLKAYRMGLREDRKLTIDKRINQIQRLGESTIEMNLMFHISVLSLSGNLASKQGPILTLKLDSAYPDILAIPVKSIPETVKALHPHLACLRDYVIKNIQSFKTSVIEIEVEYDISGFDEHIKKDDVRRTDMIMLWDNQMTERCYMQHKIEVISIKPLWMEYLRKLRLCPLL